MWSDYKIIVDVSDPQIYYWLLDLIYEVSFACNTMKIEFLYFYLQMDKKKSLRTKEIPEIISSVRHRDADSHQ
jgi:hypothetical protein